MTITIVDYGVGNLGSIHNMLKHIGADTTIARHAREIYKATKLILPGVGAFDTGMQHLELSGLKKPLDDAVLKMRIPIVGICLGMQMMTQGSEEGQLPGLGWIHANTVRFAPHSCEIVKIPHMGWNVVEKIKESQILTYLPDDSRFYFVHSYYVKCLRNEDSLLKTRYGSHTFDAAFESGNIFGFQFHPEKSHRFGMNLLKGFIEL